MQRNNNLPGAGAQALNDKIDASVNGLEYLDIAGIFGMFAKEFLHKFLEQSAKFVMFPFAAAMSVGKVYVAWRNAQLAQWDSKHKNGRLAIEIATTIPIVFAVIGALALGGAYGAMAPKIFTAALGAKTVWSACESGYFGYQAYKANKAGNFAERNENIKKSAMAGAGAGGGALVTVATYFVMVAASFILFPLGVAGGLVGTGLAIKKLYDTLKGQNNNGYLPLAQNPPVAPQFGPAPNQVPASGPVITNNAALHQGLGITNTNQIGTGNNHNNNVSQPILSIVPTPSRPIYAPVGSNTVIEDYERLPPFRPGTV